MLLGETSGKPKDFRFRGVLPTGVLGKPEGVPYVFAECSPGGREENPKISKGFRWVLPRGTLRNTPKNSFRFSLGAPQGDCRKTPKDSFKFSLGAPWGGPENLRISFGFSKVPPRGAPVKFLEFFRFPLGAP